MNPLIAAIILGCIIGVLSTLALEVCIAVCLKPEPEVDLIEPDDLKDL